MDQSRSPMRQRPMAMRFVWAAVVSWLAPAGVWAGEETRLPAERRSAPPRRLEPLKVLDFQLSRGGELKGRMVSPAGQAFNGGEVAVVRNGQVLAQGRSEQDGAFELKGLSAGPCQLRLLGASQLCRLWAPGTAPPGTPSELLLVTGEPLARGQRPIGDVVRNPLVIGLIVAAAVAIPIAVHTRDGS